MAWSLPGWLCELLTNDGTYVFFGAVLGALFGYAANRRHSRLEARARRAALFRALHRQMEMIPYTPAGLTPEAWTSRNTFHVSAVPQLLGGETLDATRDADLIRLLSLWQSLEASHNEAIHIARLASIVPGIRQEARDTSYKQVEDLHRALREQRAYLRRLVPPDSMTYSRLGNLSDDYLTWGTRTKRSYRLPFRWRHALGSRRADDWRSCLAEIAARDEQVRNANAHTRSKLEEAELLNRNRARVWIDRVVIPAIDELNDECDSFRCDVSHSERLDKDYDPLNPPQSGPRISSSSSISVGMSRRDGRSLGFYVIAVSTPDGVRARLAGTDPWFVHDYKGWAREIGTDLEALDREALIWHVLDLYRDYLDRDPER